MRRILVLAVDLALVALATVAAVLLRDNFEYWPTHLAAVAPYGVLTLAIAAAVIPLLGVSQNIWRYSALSDYLRIVAAAVLIVAGAAVAGFIYNRLEGVARSLPIIQGLLVIFALVGVRVFRRLQLRPARRFAPPLQAGKVDQHETVLVAGLTPMAELYLRSVAEYASDRVRIAGLLGQWDELKGLSIHQHTVLGTPDEVETIVRQLEVHGVTVNKIVVAKPFAKLSMKSQQALLQLETSTNIRIEFLAEMLGLSDGTSGMRGTAEPLSTGESVSNVTFAFSADDIARLAARPYWRVKRTADVLLAGILLLVLMPVMALVALLVAIDVGFPVSFWQQRPGRGGVPFRVYKFRTMAAAHDTQGRRIPDERRLTLIGSFLRRTRLDELPQLISILVGDMSFVGPRPLLPIDQPPQYAARLLARPGLTGWAQVNGGRGVSAADKAALDVWYVCNASLARDLLILLRTVPMVLFGERISHKDIKRAWRDLQAAGKCSAPALVNAESGGAKQAAA